jgi:hypothetical protein
MRAYAGWHKQYQVGLIELVHVISVMLARYFIGHVKTNRITLGLE